MHISDGSCFSPIKFGHLKLFGYLKSSFLNTERINLVRLG